MTGQTERTFIAAKPDAVDRGLVGKIIERFEQRGYKLVALKQLRVNIHVTEAKYLSFDVFLTFQPSDNLLKEHYKDLASKPFFPDLIKYMKSGPVVAMVRLHC